MSTNSLASLGLSVLPAGPASKPSRRLTKRSNAVVAGAPTVIIQEALKPQKPVADPDAECKTAQVMVESSARLYVVNSYRARTKESESWISETGRTEKQSVVYDLSQEETVARIKILVDGSDLTAPKNCTLSCAFVPNGKFTHVCDFVVDMTARLQTFFSLLLLLHALLVI